MVWVIRIGVLGQMYTEDCIFKKWVKVRHEKKFILVDISTFQLNLKECVLSRFPM